ncbi:hypothetical protein C5167_023663 [Papaver somniferum]|uniref:DUF4283 domain-containing protein n=1 Tax=Papaver somniferum TaxID=3469 RepID=A0A4Y7JQB6_PAPSO|nr:hypothetical protein C5167_023663 [Papaver somniferum]
MFVYVPLQAFSTGRPGFSISPSCNSFQISCKQVGPESKISTSIDLLKVDLITQFRVVVFAMSNRWRDGSRVRCAFSYRWFIEGGLSVSKFSQFYYLIKFEFLHEMLRVLEQGTRVIYGDIFMLHPWNPYLNPETFSLDSENFEIILHNLLPEQTQYIHLRNNTSILGELIDYSNPITSHSGYNNMYVKLRINLYQPLVFGTRARNADDEVNSIVFQFLELPRLLCNYCHKLGHLTQHCIDIYLLTHRRRQSPPPVQLAAHQILHAPPPSPEDNYSEEERFNVNIDEPDPDWNDWSLEVHPSPNSSGQEQSALSFSGAEQAYRGYNQEGFNSFMDSSSEFICLDEKQSKPHRSGKCKKQISKYW